MDLSVDLLDYLQAMYLAERYPIEYTSVVYAIALDTPLIHLTIAASFTSQS